MKISFLAQMTLCQAPARIPQEVYDRLEAEFVSPDKMPEENAIDMMMVMAEYDRPCGEPAVAEVDHNGQNIPVCAWHLEEHRDVIAPYLRSKMS